MAAVASASNVDWLVLKGAAASGSNFDDDVLTLKFDTVMVNNVIAMPAVPDNATAAEVVDETASFTMYRQGHDLWVRNGNFETPLRVERNRWGFDRGTDSTITQGYDFGTTNRLHFDTCTYDATGTTGASTGLIYQSGPITIYGSVDTGTTYSRYRLRSTRELRRDRLREQLRPRLTNHLGHVPRGARLDFSRAQPNELVALRLLRDLIRPDEFRRYLKLGLVTVRAPSGLRYELARGNHEIAVWRGGQLVARLCVFLAHEFPPTDDVIAKLLIAEQDELSLWRRANVRAGPRVSTVAELRQLAANQPFQPSAPGQPPVLVVPQRVA